MLIGMTYSGYFSPKMHTLSLRPHPKSLCLRWIACMAPAKRQETSACSGLTDAVHSEEGLETEVTVEDAPIIPSVTSYYLV